MMTRSDQVRPHDPDGSDDPLPAGIGGGAATPSASGPFLRSATPTPCATTSRGRRATTGARLAPEPPPRRLSDRTGSEALFSYTWDGPVLTIDPVATGAPGWRDFLEAYNEFCSEHGGCPLLNQTWGLTRAPGPEGVRRPPRPVRADTASVRPGRQAPERLLRRAAAWGVTDGAAAVAPPLLRRDRPA